jgi:hypothetical protein
VRATRAGEDTEEADRERALVELTGHGASVLRKLRTDEGSTQREHSPSPHVSHEKRHGLLEGRIGDPGT